MNSCAFGGILCVLYVAQKFEQVYVQVRPTNLCIGLAQKICMYYDESILKLHLYLICIDNFLCNEKIKGHLQNIA